MKYTVKRIRVDETSVTGMMGKHADAGYIIISAFRDGDGDPDILKKNKAANQQLKGVIASSGYSYIPVWGGFIEYGVDGKENIVKEQSFIVFNFKGRERQPDTKVLKALGQKWCKKFDQDAYLYKEEGGKAYYIDKNGSVTSTFSSVSPTQAADIYFTSLNKSRKKIQRKGFTFREGKEYIKGEVWMAKSPRSLAEAYTRRGEVFFKI